MAQAIAPAGVDELTALRARRAELAARIEQLRPHAFRRLELQARLAEITRRLLELEIAERSELRPVPEYPDEPGHQLEWFQK